MVSTLARSHVMRVYVALAKSKSIVAATVAKLKSPWYAMSVVTKSRVSGSQMISAPERSITGSECLNALIHVEDLLIVESIVATKDVILKN